MSLYRKYRPQRFADLVGQHYVNQTLMNAVQLQRINHAYLFTGPRGTGKTSTARILAKAINCLNLQNGEPCNSCEICNDIQEGRLIDLIEIDAASNRGIDEIRDLKEKIQFAPTRARSKVYIIDEVHMLTKEAFNALLKTLEEPPSHVYFILATTEAHKIPETILSRCQRYDFHRIDDGIIVERLQYIANQEGIKTETKALEVIARQSQGGLRDAIGLLEQLTQQNSLTFDQACSLLGVSDLSSLENLYNYLKQDQINQAIQEIHQLYSQGYDLVVFHKNFLEYLRQQMLKKIAVHDNTSTLWILGTIDNFRETYDQIKQTVIPQLPLELAIAKTCLNGEKRHSLDKGNSIAQGRVPEDVSEKKTEKFNSQEASYIKKEVQDHLKKEKTVEFTPSNDDPAREIGKNFLLEGNSTHIESDIKELDIKENSLDDKVFTFEEIKEVWPRIVEHVTSAVAKRTLQSGTLLRLEGRTIVVGFATNFQKDKMMETAHCSAVEEAASQVLSATFKLVGEIHSLAKDIRDSGFQDGIESHRAQVEIGAYDAQAKIEPQASQADKSYNESNDQAADNSSNSLSEEALKIFDGEMIE